MKASTIRHMVIFNLKHEANSSETQQFLRDGLSILTSIPVVKNFEVLNQVSAKNDFAFGFSMEFSGQEDYESYNNHPSHVKFVKERWETEVTQFLEIDFTAYTEK